MIKVNDKNIPIFLLDTEESIKLRIASTLNTTVKYLYGLPDDLKEQKEFKVVDILKEIKDDASKSLDFQDFVDKNKDLLKTFNIKKDILNLWIAYNTELQRLSPEYSTAILNLQGETLKNNGYYQNTEEFINFWKYSKDTVINDLNLQLLTEKNRNKRYIEICENFEQIEDGLGYTDLNLKRISFDMILNLKNISIIELFNHIVLNENIPFVICKNYYKILKDYIPLEEWSINTHDEILLKINEKVSTDILKHKDYIDVKIKIKDEKIVVEMSLNLEKNCCSKDDFINRFFNCFQGLENLNYTEIIEKEVNGIFYFPSETLNTYVFSDLVMNDKKFSSLINIDESSKATKKKKDIGQPWLYFHFNHPNSGHISASITEKSGDRRDPEIRYTDPEIFQHGEPYIRVKVSGKNTQCINFFQVIFSKLLVIYGKEYNKIVNIYKKYIPDFGIIYKQDIKPLEQSDIVPELFVSNYTRFCNEERFPTLIKSDDEKKKYQKNQIIKFPRDKPKNGVSYESDGKNQQNYVCLNPEFPYPGLKENNLTNRKEFPYIPCCFKTDQTKKKIYNWYYFNKEIETEEKKQQDLIKTNKILGFDQYGTLPEQLEKLFQLIDNSPEYKYIRVGVSRTKSSFLNSVILGLHDKTKITNIQDEEERILSILETRKKLSLNNIPALAKQSCYENSIDEIKRKIENEEIYFDPKLFTQLLEEYFDCSIFLFNEERMFCPRYVQSYYKNFRQKETIFIYEHLGSESDNAKYPQCELILKWKTETKDTKYYFGYQENISKNMNKIFKLMTESYAMNKKISDIKFEIPSSMSLKSQLIDNYGKTRVLNVKYKNTDISLILSPIPPLNIKTVNSGEFNLFKLELNEAKDIFDSLETMEDYVIDEENGLLETVIGNISVSIPLVGGKYKVAEQKSSLDIFNKNKKTARYIFEYVLWSFSAYIKNKKEITDKTLAEYAKNIFNIEKDYTYEIVPKKFNTNNSIMKNGKIIITSVEMMKRLMYMLKLFSIRDMNSLNNYYKRENINHYYVDINDFDRYPNQVLLQGEDSIDKWIQESKINTTLHREVLQGVKIPYFFKNDLVEDSVFLAQNTDSLEKAIDISLKWLRKGYNIGEDAEISRDDRGFVLYSYKNGDEIKKIHVEGLNFTKKIRILGYKIQYKSYYTCLLEL